MAEQNCTIDVRLTEAYIDKIIERTYKNNYSSMEFES